MSEREADFGTLVYAIHNDDCNMAEAEEALERIRAHVQALEEELSRVRAERDTLLTELKLRRYADTKEENDEEARA